MFYMICATVLFSGLGSYHIKLPSTPYSSVIWLKSDPKKSPAIALFLFVGYILSFVVRFIVNAPDSLLIKHEHDLVEFEFHRRVRRALRTTSTSTFWSPEASVYKL